MKKQLTMPLLHLIVLILIFIYPIIAGMIQVLIGIILIHEQKIYDKTIQLLTKEINNLKKTNKQRSHDNFIYKALRF